jgi:5'-3' exoribonuclease 1
MGIPAYFSYIVKNYPNILRQFSNPKDFSLTVNNFYLDANSIIYDAVRSSDVASIIPTVIAKICDYLHQIKPTERLIIAFDGVAPVAKLEQQRQRRYKTQYQNQLTQTILTSFAQKEKDKETKRQTVETFNTTAITPGTSFMKELCTAVREYFEKNTFDVKEILLFLSDVPGEGEHKIFDFIRDNCEPLSLRRETHVIYGLDADLIMLSLNHLDMCPQTYLFRETPEFIKSISQDLEPNELYIIDIANLAISITEELTGEKDTLHFNKISDYILICFFLGNDFMPHFPSLNLRTGGIHKVMNAYKSLFKDDKTIVKNRCEIQWRQLKRFIGFLAKYEEKNIIVETEKREKAEKRYFPITTAEEVLTKFESLPTYEREVESKINPTKSGWQNRYYSLLCSGRDEREICIDYLHCLQWTMKYYSQGCTDWRFKYNHAYAPLLQDLETFCSEVNILSISCSGSSSSSCSSSCSSSSLKPISELTQLCYVLPRNCLNLLPFEFERALTDKFNTWYTNNPTFLWAYCRYFWESHVLLPEINIEELESFISTFFSPSKV